MPEQTPHTLATPDALIEAKLAGAPGDAPLSVAQVAANYQYWRQHGGEWASEYDARKKDQPYYHIQELMLSEYVAALSKKFGGVRVLEVGCGVGRHLSYLRHIPGADINGYDQSATMVAGCLRWAEPEWLEQHVKVGLPTGRLPYADGEFDLVYTAEVLVHVRPEDLPGILRELVRISKREVLHIETSPWHELVSNEHSGCWWHDLVQAYAGIGQRCEMLDSGYSTHSPYRVLPHGHEAVFAWSPVTLSLYRRMERDLLEGLNDLRVKAFDAGEAAKSARAELESAAAARDAATAAGAELAAQLDETRVALALTQRARALAEDDLRRVGGELEDTRRHAIELANASDERFVDERRRVAALERELSVVRSRVIALTAKQQAFARRAREMMGM